jgi:hypothetical protein
MMTVNDWLSMTYGSIYITSHNQDELNDHVAAAQAEGWQVLGKPCTFIKDGQELVSARMQRILIAEG